MDRRSPTSGVVFPTHRSKGRPLPKVSLRSLPMHASVLIAAMSVAPVVARGESRAAVAVGAGTADTAFRVDTWPDAVVDEIGDRVFGLALSATRCATAAGDVDRPATLTVIDYSKPSPRPR